MYVWRIHSIHHTVEIDRFCSYLHDNIFFLNTYTGTFFIRYKIEMLNIPGHPVECRLMSIYPYPEFQAQSIIFEGFGSSWSIN